VPLCSAACKAGRCSTQIGRQVWTEPAHAVISAHAVQSCEGFEHLPGAVHLLLSQGFGGVLHTERTGSIDMNFAQSTVTGNFASSVDVRALGSSFREACMRRARASSCSAPSEAGHRSTRIGGQVWTELAHPVSSAHVTSVT